MRKRQFLALGAAMAGAVAGSASASAAAAQVARMGPSMVADALDRPAIAVRAPERAVLLAAASSGTRVVAVGERGIVALSDDGKAWRQVAVPASVTLTAVRFAPDGRHVFAVGHSGMVLRSDDAGEHWQRMLDGRRIASLMLTAARAVGDARAIKQAQSLVDDGPDKPLLDLLVHDEQHVLVVGAYGLALETRDAGASWSSWMTRLDNPKGLHLNAVRSRGDELLLAGEQGLALRSQDAGKTFHRLEPGYKGSFFTAEMPADGSIVLAGLRGHAVMSSDHGGSWTPVPDPMPMSIVASAIDRSGTALFANQGGFVLALREGRLVPLGGPPVPPINAILPLASGPLLALTVNGLLPIPTP